jgi:hypothetical protein
MRTILATAQESQRLLATEIMRMCGEIASRPTDERPAALEILTPYLQERGTVRPPPEVQHCGRRPIYHRPVFAPAQTLTDDEAVVLPES